MSNSKKMLSLLMAVIIILLSVISSTAIVTPEDSASAQEQWIHKIDKALLDKMALASSNEKIPVYVWYEDVSQTTIDTKVKRETGLSIENLSVDVVMPDVDLLNVANLDDKQSIDKMQQYLEATKVERKKEKENSNLYIDTRRSYSRLAYAEKSQQIKNIVSVNSSDIIFSSSYAPLILCELTITQIEQLANDNRIETIGYYEEPISVDCESYESVTHTTNQYRNETLLGLTGDGVDVGMVETGYPEAHVELDLDEITFIGSGYQRAHATGTARILKGTVNGLAKNINLYSTNNNLQNIETMLSMGVDIINMSSGWSCPESDTTENYAYSLKDKWFDHVVAHHNVTVVVSAGNDAQGTVYENDPEIYKRVISPGMAHNVITVGAYHDMDTYDVLTDDILNNSSSYKNDNIITITKGIEKPDVVMPCNIIQNNGATSHAAPTLTAIIAQIIELKPSLAAYPQAIKAIVMASCHRKVLSSTDGEEQETMIDGITERQGAGAPDAWTMACIVSQGTYGVDVMGTSETGKKHRFLMPKYGADKLNVSLTWLRNNTCNGVDGSNVGVETDFDLYIYNNLNRVIGYSEEWYSSTEMAYVSLTSANDVYTIGIEKANNNYTEPVRYGYAYSTNNPYISPVTNEGVYYIKSNVNNNYLTYNETTNNLELQPFNNNASQQWIVRKVNGYYGVYPNCSSVNGYMMPLGDLNTEVTEIPEYLNVSFNNITPNIHFQTYDKNIVLDEGSCALLAVGREYSYALSYSNDTVRFDYCSNTSTYTDNMQWNFEKLHYRKGDINSDEVIDIIDVNYVENYYLGYWNLDKISVYLADINYDGLVDILDKTKLQRIVAGYDLY